MDKSQLLKGFLEGCILKIIDSHETYGYEIVTKLQEYGFTDVKEGTLYPLLLRLEKKELIYGVFKESPLGPKRKYYNLTQEGKEYVKSFYEYWSQMEASIHKIFREV